MRLLFWQEAEEEARRLSELQEERDEEQQQTQEDEEGVTGDDGIENALEHAQQVFQRLQRAIERLDETRHRGVEKPVQVVAEKEEEPSTTAPPMGGPSALSSADMQTDRDHRPLRGSEEDSQSASDNGPAFAQSGCLVGAKRMDENTPFREARVWVREPEGTLCVKWEASPSHPEQYPLQRLRSCRMGLPNTHARAVVEASSLAFLFPPEKMSELQQSPAAAERAYLPVPRDIRDMSAFCLLLLLLLL